MSYIIGSFNMCKLGKNADNEGRNLQRIADIIQNENFDVIALQEISTGETFTQENGILQRLGNNYEFRRGNAHGDGLGFLWKKARFRLIEEPKILDEERIKHNLSKAAYYGRFIPIELSAERSFELCLICIHIIFGNDFNLRRQELDVWLKDVLPRYSTINNGKKCTILCGDYNLELFRTGRNKEKCIVTTTEDIIELEKNNMRIKTVQDQPTTISGVVDNYTSNFDHFSFDNDLFQSMFSYRIIDCGYNYDDLQTFKREVSDHIPIKMEIDLR